MRFSGLVRSLGLLAAALPSIYALPNLAGTPSNMIMGMQNDTLQDIVTWDEQSIFVHGERVLFYSGEFHPYRLPVPGLWLDILQKIKSLGYSGVSFYTDWALLEGKSGVFNASGIFDLTDFFDAAKQTGIYLLARPGPYINAESSGGGYPGWLQRIPGLLRTPDPTYLDSTTNYVKQISAIIAEQQITNGGPVILLQPENEYSHGIPGVEFPNPTYFGYVEQQYRNAGIVVPFLSNDAGPFGYFAPPKPAHVDIYGHDSYPLLFDCANPYTWPDQSLPLDFRTLHEQQSPTTPYAITEFQGGSFDPWGGSGFTKCTELLNEQFERVFYKNLFSFGMTMFNIYMTYGGTNWGNLGHPGGYTSYDYGAVIKEDRSVTREKFSEAKLIANFLKSVPAYLTAIPQNNTNANGSYCDTQDIAVTAVLSNTTNFFVARQAAFNYEDSTNYTLTIPTTQGNLTIPQLGGVLTMPGRDSKIHTSGYMAGNYTLLYSSAEIFTWKQYTDSTVLVLYGGPGEQHEFALESCSNATLQSGPDVTMKTNGSTTIINFVVSPEPRMITAGNLQIHVVDRNTAYNYWVLSLPTTASTGNYTNFTTASTTDLIVSGGYLMRTASLDGCSLALTGDLNASTPISVAGAPSGLQSLTFNGQNVSFQQDCYGVHANLTYTAPPSYQLPDLSTMNWKYIDSLPEVQPGYDDSLWTVADLTYSNNTARNLTTPTSTYASDYGYNTGTLVYRGSFVANGQENELYLLTQGGTAYGMSAWINGTYLTSYPGISTADSANTTVTLPSLTAGQTYVITVVCDNMGLDENQAAGLSMMKNPRGVLNFLINSHNQSDITWKLTGNLHGEDYEDRTRGPLNEGGMYAERQGWHLPGAPIDNFTDVVGGPLKGISSAGIGFYGVNFDLNMPEGYDIPLYIDLANSTSSLQDYRLQLFVNGYQYGKYVNNIGPQTSFPVPPGIWNYNGSNYMAVTLWALESQGAQVTSLNLTAGFPVQSAYGPVALAPMTGWTQRAGAY